MQINTKDYLPFTDALELSQRSSPTFYEHVLRGNITYIEIGRLRLYSRKDIMKLANKPKQPNQTKDDVDTI